MGKNAKMCKYKSFKTFRLIDYANSWQTIICSNPEITEEEIKKINSDHKLCSRRLCPHYESR